MLWLSNYVECRTDVTDTSQSSLEDSPGQTVMADFEFVQRPSLYLPPTVDKEDSDSDMGFEKLGLRTLGDGAEIPDEFPRTPPLTGTPPGCRTPPIPARSVRFDDAAKKHDGRSPFDRQSIQIAALFSKELAAQLHEEKVYLSHSPILSILVVKQLIMPCCPKP